MTDGEPGAQADPALGATGVRQFDDASFDHWSAIPPDSDIQIALKRSDVDNLLLSTRRLQDAMTAVLYLFNAAGLVEPGPRTTAINEAGQHLISSMNHMTDFMNSAFRRAEPIE